MYLNDEKRERKDAGCRKCKQDLFHSVRIINYRKYRICRFGFER